MPSDRRALALQILIVLVALTFLVTGASKVFALGESPANFARWGFSPLVMYAIGAVEIVSGLALLVPRLSPFAALLLLGTMVGALRTGLVFHEALHIALPSLLMLLLALITYARRASILGLLGRA